MKLQFLGATNTVTGSRYLLTANGKKYLIDCGLFQGLKELRLRNWEKFTVEPNSIDAVILSHAHLDHSGYLPLLVKNGFSGKVYCTELTKELCGILLPDSGHLQEEEANRANRYGYSKHKPALPLYTRADAENCIKYLEPIPFEQEFTLEPDLTLQFRRAGHILGASSILLRNTETSILFSGDLGRAVDPCVIPPDTAATADYLIIESTYGDRLHESVNPMLQLGDIINRTAQRGGTVIMPAFTVGRTQTILYFIHLLKKNKQISDIPVFLDSPMAESATTIMLKHTEEHRVPDSDCNEVAKVAQFVTTVEHSKQIDTYTYPKIIISASGMATGGRVLHHIKVFAGDSRNTILFAGYQAAGTRGALMLQGAKQVKMLGEIIPIHAEVVELDNVSAHADYQEMLTWLGSMPQAPRKVFITHGEPEGATALKAKIEAQFHWNCVIPNYLDSFTL
jgi:metallo-beta-lactamase family protein